MNEEKTWLIFWSYYKITVESYDDNEYSKDEFLWACRKVLGSLSEEDIINTVHDEYLLPAHNGWYGLIKANTAPGACLKFIECFKMRKTVHMEADSYPLGGGMNDNC